jgi:hypothetical protein
VPDLERDLLKIKKTGIGSKVHFKMTRDNYINQHLVNLEPVVPGTFVTEIFAEALENSDKSASLIKFRRPMQMRGDTLEVEVVGDDTHLMLVPANRPELQPKALANLAYSSCKLEKASPGDGARLKISKADYKRLIEQSLKTSASFYSLLDSKFYKALKTGPVFRGVRAVLEEGNIFYSLVTMTSQGCAALAMPGEFVFNPILADMAVQVAAAWAMQRHDAMEIPFEIASLQVAGQMNSLDALVICEEVSITDKESTINVAVRNTDGSLILTMDKLVLKTIMSGGD